MKFTTSWDDGYADDLRIAELLDTYGCLGTFYVCPRGQHRQDMLTQDQIHDLSARHEIGAHTITHPRLTQIPENDARRRMPDFRGREPWNSSGFAMMICSVCRHPSTSTHSLCVPSSTGARLAPCSPPGRIFVSSAFRSPLSADGCRSRRRCFARLTSAKSRGFTCGVTAPKWKNTACGRILRIFWTTPGHFRILKWSTIATFYENTFSQR
ncbi:MAG: Polysaccharide deacetylase [Candidatus Peribacteria bacterium GW2011_GWB1_54_5]|nr:MAG: Polysaccharide deacetylase [Candidatus Peribacteria bacterium GW2011_GWB1_54_5]